MNYLNLLGVSSAPPGADTGWLTAGTVTDMNLGGTAWTNLANIRVPDGIYGTVSLGSFKWTRTTWFSNFGASIPSGSTITGLELRGKGLSSVGGTFYLEGAFTPSGTVNWNSSWQSGFFPTSDGYVTVGGPGQLFGLSLTPSIVTASNWGFYADGITDSAAAIAYLDSIEMKIYYTPPP